MALQVFDQGNAIVVPLEIKLDKLENLRDIVKELKQIDSKTSTTPQDSGLSVYGWEDEIAFEAMMQNFLRKNVGGNPTQIMGNMTGMLNNPQSFIMGLLSHPAVAAALIASGLGFAILEFMMMQGNVLDKYFKRELVKENIKGRRREERQQIRAGLGRGIIITNRHGSTSPETAYNSYEAVNSEKGSQAEAFQIRKGYRY